jgi:hypothetical protein
MLYTTNFNDDEFDNDNFDNGKRKQLRIASMSIRLSGEEVERKKNRKPGEASGYRGWRVQVKV